MKLLVVIVLALSSASLLLSEELAEGEIRLMTSSFRSITIFEDGSVTTCADSQGKYTFCKAPGSVDYKKLRIRIEKEVNQEPIASSRSQTMVAIKGGATSWLADDEFLRKIFVSEPNSWKHRVETFVNSNRSVKFVALSENATKYLLRCPIYDPAGRTRPEN